MKPMNWISATGRRPVSAMPNAVPTIADSASGVSNTRFGPNRAWSPSVARNTPPSLPTSWPITTTRSSAPSACSSARLMAWTMMASATGGLDVRLERRDGPRLRLGDGTVDARQRVLHRLALGVLAPQPPLLQIAAEARQRVAPAPVLDLLGRLVAPRVVRGGVRADAVRQRLDQCRPLAAPRAFDRPVAGGVHGQRVVAVDQHAGHAVRQAFLRQRLAPGQAGARHADGPVVVLDEQHRLRVEHASEVERLEEVT